MKKHKLIISLVALLVIGTVGATFAYYTSSKSFTNKFVTGEYGTVIREKFESPSDWAPGDVTEKIVNVKNTGDVEIAARIAITETWTSKGGNDLSKVITVNNAEEKIALFTTGSNWVLNADGKYYYNTKISSGTTTQNFIENVTFNPNFALVKGRDIDCTEGTDAEGYMAQTCTSTTTGYAGATYTLVITVETIQADAATAANGWNHQYN